MMSGFSSVFKANPYHDELGRFSDHDGAKFVSIGGVFSKHTQRMRDSNTRRDPESDYSMGLLDGYVDTKPIRDRIDAINAKIDEHNSFVDEVKSGTRKDHAKMPTNGEGLGELTDSDLRDAFSSKKVSIYMAASRATLKKILRGDTFKNSLETGKGTFKTIGSDRAVKERQFLGVRAEESDPSGFPKYGFVANKGKMDYDGIVAFGYGDAYVEFHDSIRERTTVTIGDSFNNNSYGRTAFPGPINNVGSSQFQRNDKNAQATMLEGAAKYKESGDMYDLLRGSEYAEAQIYGILDAAHIKAIHVESKKTAKDLEAAIRKTGMPIQLKPTDTHTYLKRLSEGELDAWHKLSPEDLKNLGDAYLPKGWGSTGSNLWAKGWEKDLPKMNVPKIKEAIAKYPNYRDVPVSEMRSLMEEYMMERRKGADGTFPKVLRSKKSVNDGFTADVFNEKLLKEYP